jgi:hypothetical protein
MEFFSKSEGIIIMNSIYFLFGKPCKNGNAFVHKYFRFVYWAMFEFSKRRIYHINQKNI